MNESAPPPDPSSVVLAVRQVPDSLTADGLALHKDFVSAAEEAAILAYLDTQPWDGTLKRRTQHYGRRFDYLSKSVSTGAAPPAVPSCIALIVDRLLPLAPWDASRVDDVLQVTVNEYKPGVGIAAHIDTHSAFTDGIISLSLCAGVTFRMKRDAEDHSLWLPPRSLLVLSGASRYAWRHSISGRRYDRVELEAPVAATGEADSEFEWIARSRRVSVTLRLVLPSGCCGCAWPLLCDAQGGAPIALPTRLAPTSNRPAVERTQAKKQSESSSRRIDPASAGSSELSSLSATTLAAPPAAIAAAPPRAPPKDPMGHFAHFPSRRVMLALVCFRLLNAVLVRTYHDPDEHWQCSEVAHRMVHGQGALTWEWLYGLRGYTHILPFAAMLRALHALQLDSPILVAHAPRLLQGFLCGLGDVCLWAFAEGHFGAGSGLSAVACSCTSWFVWYVGVRTYSSSMEGVLLMAGLALLPSSALWDQAMRREEGARPVVRLAAAAALGTLSFVVRPTALLLLLPLGASVARQWTAPAAVTSAAAAAAAAVAACLSVLVLSFVVDRLGYGRWLLVSANFVRFNLFAGGSEYYGTHPWHWYFSMALPAALGTHAPLVINGVLLAFSRASPNARDINGRTHSSIVRAPALAAVLMLNVLSLASHKELRFLYAIVHACFMAYAGTSLNSMNPRARRRCVQLLALTNILPATYLSLVHQRAPMSLFEDLRIEVDAGRLTHIDMLTRCHETPGLAQLHSAHVTLTMLHCPPPAIVHATAATGWSLPPSMAAMATLSATGSDQVPWVASARELRRNFPASPSDCKNECDCFLAQPREAIVRRYSRARRRERWWSWRGRVSRGGGGERSSAALSRLPSHVAIFEELLSEIPLLHDLGYVQHSSYWHAPHLAGWHGMWPIIESRRLLLLRRQK